MSEKYFNLKRKLEELGYNNNLPLEAVPLVECVLADLLQTTRSLQNYMDLSKDVLAQRDKLVLELEPYKCDNTKLLQDNNKLHKQLMVLKEQCEKSSKENMRKIKSLSEELKIKEQIISKLQLEIRELNLRGLCAETISSRGRSKRKDCNDEKSYKTICVCSDNLNLKLENEVVELKRKVQSLEEENSTYLDEIILMKNQVESRDNEIIRLNMLLEGGRPLHGLESETSIHSNKNINDLTKQLKEVESLNELLKKEIDTGLEKQHEAMLRALNLADSNKSLKDELAKVDELALQVEADCNRKLSVMKNELNSLQNKMEQLTQRNLELEKKLFSKNNAHDSTSNMNVQELLNIALKEKDVLQKEIKDLLELNKSLQSKLLSTTRVNNNYGHKSDSMVNIDKEYATRDELKDLLESERIVNEKQMKTLQDKLTDTINVFERHLSRCKESDTTSSPGKMFIKDLHNKLCESEQKILMLKKENEELINKVFKQKDNSNQNYKDIISQLNKENSDLTKENLSLSRELSKYKNSFTMKSFDDRNDFQKLKVDYEKQKQEIALLNKDREEYKLRYNESMVFIENLRRDLLLKQKQVEQLEQENCTYRMTNRTGQASTEHLKEECNYLRDQIKKMQTDVIKEKTMASQIKNIQIETERSSNEIQNELLNTQKQLSLSRNNSDTFERKCNDLQSEILSYKMEKSTLIENIKKLDKERDQLIMELDHKTETLSALEQKLKTQTFDIEKLENQVADLTRKLNINKISEHKLVDYDTQIRFLNGEISRLTQQFDNALMENKHLQNSLADANGSLKITKIEYEKSRKEVDGLKQQLQHYVAEIRRIEELLSQKEAERSDMLEHYASLSVEANILENTNHSLESESASKSLQLQSYISKIHDLESKILEKENIITNQSTRIASMTCKITALESEVKLMTEEKEILEKNVSHLKQMCKNLQEEKTNMSKENGNTDSELKLYENKIKSLSNNKRELESENSKLKEKLESIEKLLYNARNEIIELKLTLQDATSETKLLKEKVHVLNKMDTEFQKSLAKELELPLMLEETIQEVSLEEDEDSAHYHDVRRRFSKFTHSGTI